MAFEIVKLKGKSAKKEKVDVLEKGPDGWGVRKKDLPVFEVKKDEAVEAFKKEDVRVLRWKKD